MKSKFYIKYRAAPVGEEGPLVLRIEDDIRIISATIAPQRVSPKGLSVDGYVIFDMQSDGGVDGIEILCPFWTDLTSRRARPRLQEQFWRLFLNPSGKEINAPNVKVVMRRLGRFATIQFKIGDVNTKYLLGPGIMALVGANELLGLEIEMVKFIWPEPDFVER